MSARMPVVEIAECSRGPGDVGTQVSSRIGMGIGTKKGPGQRRELSFAFGAQPRLQVSLAYFKRHRTSGGRIV